MEFSVLMSVYVKESAENLKQSLDSILVNQSILPSEVILVEDGRLNDSLDNLITEYEVLFPKVLKVIKLKENIGLGGALNLGLNYCNYELVARMDSDDISSVNRFQLQLEEFKNNQNLDLVGGYIAEFYISPTKIESIRKVPNDLLAIKKMMKIRNPINHVTVMFRKSSIIKAGGYKSLLFLEDYYLWVRMVICEMNLENISIPLVLVRTGENMFKRRSNDEYIGSWRILQKIMLENQLINHIEYLRNMINIFLFIKTPPTVKKIIYKFILRS